MVVVSIFEEGSENGGAVGGTICRQWEYEALIVVERGLINNYVSVSDREVLRSIIHPDTWKERQFEQRLCRGPRMDPDLKLETWLRGDEVRFECLLELKNLLQMSILAAEKPHLDATEQAEAAARAERRKQRLEREAQERMAKIRERTARTERDAQALAAWWSSLSDKEREFGLKGVLRRLGISHKEMNELWSEAGVETKLSLMGMAMYILETRKHVRAKDLRAQQAGQPAQKPVKKGRGRGHLRLVTQAA